MTLSEYLIEAVASRRTGKYKTKLVAENLSIDGIKQLLSNIGYKRFKDVKNTSYSLRELENKCGGTNSWISMTGSRGLTFGILVFTENHPGKILRFTSLSEDQNINVSEIIDISERKLIYEESYGKGYEDETVNMVNTFLDLK